MGGFSNFYPLYLSQHTNRTCRRLHFIGTTLGLMWKDMLTGRIRF